MDPADALLRLQERDLAIARLTKQLEEMPEKRAILAARAKIAEIRGLEQRARAVAHGIDQSIKRFEDETAAIAEKIDAEQAKLLSGQVKNPKELQAISHELDSLKKRMDEIEGETLAQMQKRENAGQQADKIAAAVANGEAKEAELTARFKDRGGHLLAEIEQENAERAKLLAGLPADLRDRYESVRASKNGIAVGVLQGAMCSVCRVGLPAGAIASLEKGPEIASCPSCQRILIVRGADRD